MNKRVPECLDYDYDIDYDYIMCVGLYVMRSSVATSWP